MYRNYWLMPEAQHSEASVTHSPPHGDTYLDLQAPTHS